MRLLILLLFFPYILTAQVIPTGAEPVSGIPQGLTADIITIAPPIAQEGFMVFSTDEQIIYYYDGANWVPFDDQDASEVNTIASRIDLNGDTVVDAADIIDADGDAVVETTVQDVIEAITPITAKAGRVFYPPSIEIDASVISGVANETIELYQQYANQYDLTQNSTVINGVTVNYQTAKSTSAPDNIPIYQPDELYYYVTFADESVFNIIGDISDTGTLTYRIVGTPTSDNTLINVVFVVK